MTAQLFIFAGVRKVLLPISLLLMVVAACRKGFEGVVKQTQPPKTFLLIDTIERYGGYRLTAQVTMNWWGTDANGYIKGYEWSLDKIAWHFTKKTDSTFIFNTPFGSDTGNIWFWVRAVDNNNVRDPNPVHVVVPIKNTPPSIAFQPGPTNPTRSLPYIRFYFNAVDIDGANNLHHIEMVWNDSTALAYKARPTATSAMFEATDMHVTGSVKCHVYTNNNTFADTGLAGGMRLNATNILYIRAVDNARKASKWVGSYAIYIKKPQSTIAFVNAYGYTGALPTSYATIQHWYLSHIATQLSLNADTIQLYEKNAVTGYTQLAPDLFTQSKIFALYKTIIWAGSDARQSLSLGERTLTTFINNGGKLLFSAYVNSSFDPNASFLDFTPASSLYVPADTNLIIFDTSHLPALVASYPVLQSTQFSSVVRPFNLNYGATSLYTAYLTARKVSTGNTYNWKGSYPVIAKKTDGSGNTNFVFSTLELHTLDGGSNMDAFFKQVLHGEFGL